jgi:hypothetical protein
MEKAFIDQLIPLYPQSRKKIYKTLAVDWKLATIDISMISTAGFILNCQNSETVLFSIILKEINCEIQN